MARLFKKTATTRMIFFGALDTAFIALSIWVAFWLRFDGVIPSQYIASVYMLIALAVAIVIPVFYVQKLYSFSWAYVSTNEALALFKATTISFIGVAVAGIAISDYLPQVLHFPRSTIFISYTLVLILSGSLRLAKRIYTKLLPLGNQAENHKTLIVGAGDAGEQILRNILATRSSPYYPVGFVDDSPIKQGVSIHGLRVLGKITDIPRIAAQHGVKQLIIALPSASNKLIKDAVELGRQARLRKIKIAPPLSEIIRGEVSLKSLKDVEVEDLLGREAIVLDKKQIEQFVKGKTVLITGAAGSIGSELSRQVARFNPAKLILLDQDETGIFTSMSQLQSAFSGLPMQPVVADITDAAKMQGIFAAQKPHIVFHAAAYKHVPLMEAQPDEAVKNNVFGTQVLAQACLKNSVETFIFISTDKAVNPTSVMGATKRVGEMICQAYNQKNGTKFISVRFGNVLNSRGSVIPIFKDQIKKGGPVEVTDPAMKRYFMLISEACLLVMQAGAIGKGGEVFVLNMGEPVKIVDLAREMIRLSGFEPDRDIAIVFTGIRPGEKLFEEMLTAQEGVIATGNENIFIAKLSQVEPAALEREIERLGAMLYAGDDREITAALHLVAAGV